MGKISGICGSLKKPSLRRLLLGILTAAVCIGSVPVYAEEGQISASGIWGAQEDGGPEPAPDTEADLSAEGMIGPSSKAENSSVFGQVSEEAVMDDRLSEVMSKVEASLPVGNGSWSVYVCDLAGGAEGCIGETPRQAASLIKLFIMGAVYEQYEELTALYGKDYVDAHLNAMITVSDNDAANTLTGALGRGDTTAGMQVVNAFCVSHGFNCSSMGRLLLQSNEFGDNYTSVLDCGRFLKKIYSGGGEEFPHAADMFSLLAGQTRTNKIPAQMPEGVCVANKTGELSDVENDAGIIYNSSNDLVIVFMSENLSECGSAQSTIASLSRMIYDSYNG